jgi:hypothetical protein
MKKALLLTALVSVVAAGGFWGGVYWERNKDIPFNALLWRAGGPSQTIARDTDPFRHKMVRDLLAQHLHKGMSRAQVIRLLGEPESEVIEERQISYWLNQEYPSWGIGIDPKTTHNLVIELDAGGNVQKINHQVFDRKR